MKVKPFNKAKARRVFKNRRRQVDELTDSASRNIDRHIFKRLTNFADVGRFIGAWLLLMMVLIVGVFYQTRSLREYYLSPQPSGGGILSEGMIGTYTNPNPLFASSTVDLSVSKLIFNSLLTYDDNGALVTDLAESITRSDDGLSYTVTLQDSTLWQDGYKVTSDDILYTYTAIQNPDTRSPYNISWQGIKLDKVDERTVKFTLPSPLNSFPLSLTNGIVPAHLLKDVPYEQLRSSTFNASPVGTGPFKLTNVVRIDEFETIKKRQRVELVRNDAYFKGRPELEAFVIYALSDEQDVKEFLDSRQIDTAVYNSSPDLSDGDKQRLTVYSAPLLAGTYLFFNTSKAPFDSPDLRKALVSGTDIHGVLASLGYPVQEVVGPLLSSHVGFDPAITQTNFDVARANQLLDTAGWVKSADQQFRAKDGTSLEVTITTLQGSDFASVASTIQGQWAKDLGIKVNIITKSPADMQPIVLQHGYDVLLYGITLGTDPDVFAYWHSSQAVTDRFNLSMYKSTAADQALEAGRSRPDITLRAIKYKPFLEAWKNDAPALGLYQPPFFYVSNTKIFGFEPRELNGVVDRFNNVHNWQINIADQPIVKE